MKKKWKIILIIVISILVLGSAGFYFYKSYYLNNIKIGQSFFLKRDQIVNIYDGDNKIVLVFNGATIGGSFYSIYINDTEVPEAYCGISSSRGPYCDYNKKILSEYGYKININKELTTDNSLFAKIEKIK